MYRTTIGLIAILRHSRLAASSADMVMARSGRGTVPREASFLRLWCWRSMFHYSPRQPLTLQTCLLDQRSTPTWKRPTHRASLRGTRAAALASHATLSTALTSGQIVL